MLEYVVEMNPVSYFANVLSRMSYYATIFLVFIMDGQTHSNDISFPLTMQCLKFNTLSMILFGFILPIGTDFTKPRKVCNQ